MQILVSISTVGASPQIGKILPLCDFFDCPVLSLPFSRSRSEVAPLDRFSQFMAQTMCFRARKCRLGIRTMGDHIWGKYAPKPPNNENDVFPRKEVPFGDQNNG